MKIRSGYVSNSSSSSFVVQYSLKKKLRLAKGISIDFRDFLDLVERCRRDWCSDETEIDAEGRDQVEAKLQNDEWTRDRYAGVIEKLKHVDVKKNDVVKLDIAYSDKIIKTLLDAFVAKGVAETLDEEEA